MTNMNNYTEYQIARMRNVKSRQTKNNSKFEGFVASMLVCLLAAVEFIVFFGLPF